jgi:hypothetical protein
MIPASWRRIVLAAGGAMTLILGCWWLSQRVYFAPAAQKRAQITGLRQQVDRLKEQVAPQFEVRKRLEAIAATGLSPQRDLAAHQMRTLLSRIGQASRLNDLKVTDLPAREAISPAVRAFSGSAASALRQRPDFVVLPGSLEGTGTLEQVLATLAALQSQPWIHRVEGFSLRPAGRRAERLTLKVEVSSLLMPDLSPRDRPAPEVAPTSPAVEALWRPVALRDLFKDAAVAQAPAAPPADPPAAAVSPYAQWRLAGLVVSELGAEAIFAPVAGGPGLTVRQGESILDAKLVGGRMTEEGEAAVLEVNGERFLVRLGQTLAARAPAGG